MYTAIAHGAYGRSANVADWKAGKDFSLWQGPYFSIRDLGALAREDYFFIRFLDNKGREAFTVNVNTGKVSE